MDLESWPTDSGLLNALFWRAATVAGRYAERKFGEAVEWALGGLLSAIPIRGF